jgi:hypothetical protein
MFTHTCTACERRQLIFPSMVTGVVDSPNGPTVAFECWCGASQTMTREHALIQAVAA